MPQKKARPDTAIAKAKEEISAKAKAAVKDKKCLNGLLELLANLDLEEEPTKLDVAKAVASVRCLTEAFQQFQSSGDLDQADSDKGEEDATSTVSSWLKERHEVFWECLGSLVATDVEESLNEFALVGAFRLIRASHRRREKVRLVSEGESFVPLDHWMGEEVKRLRNHLLPALCSSGGCKAKQIKRFKQYLDFQDIKQHVIQGLLKLLKQKVKESQKSGISVHFVRNTLCMLECLNFSKPTKKQEENPNTFLCQDEESGEGSTFVYDHESVRKSFSELWELFLKQKLDVESYKRALLMLDEKVIPHLTRPLLLTDFLVSSYSIGGPISILALGGVFNLMQKYNLEYPDFYAKLYALFKPDVLHAKYRARFLYMSNLFLTSTHLPEYLVASFVKRAARLALTAPSNALLSIVPFIGNLLIRHPGLIKMLHGREDSNDDEVADPYIIEETDPSKCKAADSSLWEILSLQQHVLPQVSQSVKAMSARLKLPLEQRVEWDLSEFLEIGMSDMMADECKKKIFVNVPLNFERPCGLAFSKDGAEVVSKHFKMA